jgi:putative aminopeptidase FrvX
MRLAIIAVTLPLAALAGCASRAELARLDDEKCQSYGAQPGSAAYVQCRTQLDTTRTVARAMDDEAGTIALSNVHIGQPN